MKHNWRSHNITGYFVSPNGERMHPTYALARQLDRVQELEVENKQLWEYALACYPECQGPDWEERYPIVSILREVLEGK